jgi:hypothetical protein
MNLTQEQAHAMLELGGSAEGHGFLPQRVLDELLSYELIYWRRPDEVDFTSRGKDVYDELTISANVARRGRAKRNRATSVSEQPV